MDTLGKTVKTLRCRESMSLQDLATDAGISKAHIWDIERGVSKNPSVDTLCRLSLALGASPTDIAAVAMNEWFSNNQTTTKTKTIVPKKGK